MKMNPTTGIILGLFSLAVCGSCAAQIGPVKGSGNLKTKIYSNSGFTRIDLSNDVTGRIRYADTYSVEISVDDNIAPYLILEQKGERLKIGLNPLKNYVNLHMNVLIATPDIRTIALSDDSKIDVSGFTFDHYTALSLVDGCSLKGDGSFADVGITMTDDCTMELSGTCKDIDLKVIGTCKLNSQNLSSVNASVDIEDDSTALLNCSGFISGKVLDGSTLIYTGNPTSVTVKAMDSTVERR